MGLHVWTERDGQALLVWEGSNCMRHKSSTTTQGYINMARQMNAAVASLHVPEVLRQVQS